MVMLYAKATTAVIRNGAVVPGGKLFGIAPEEKDEMIRRGFQIVEKDIPDPPKSDNVNITPEEGTRGNTGDIPGDRGGADGGEDEPKVLSGGSSPAAPKMAGTAKTSVSSAPKKEGK